MTLNQVPHDAVGRQTLRAGEHTEKTFWNLVNSNRNQIVFTIFRSTWIQTDAHLDANQSESGKYNLILV